MTLTKTDLEQLYQFYDRSLTVSDLEAWIYKNPDLEDRLGADDYLDLISIDFRHHRAWQDIHHILAPHISAKNFVIWKLTKILKNVINRSENVHRDIEELYHIYCDGYPFLRRIALNYGLSIIDTPNRYSSSHYSALTPAEQEQLLDEMYPEIIEHAQRALDCLTQEKIVFTEFDNANLEHGFPKNPEYQDRRSRRERRLAGVKGLNLNNPIVRFFWRRLKIPIYSYHE